MVEIDYGYKILVSLRLLLMQVINITFVTIVMHYCLEKRNSYKCLVIWEVVRLLFINNLLGTILEDARMANPQLQRIYTILYILAAFITCGTYLFTFKDVPKTAFLFVFVEPVIVVMQFPGQAIASYVQNRPMTYEIPLVPLDILMYGINIFIFVLVLKYGRRLFTWFKERPFRHPRFWCWFTFFYIISISFISTTIDMSLMYRNILSFALVTLAGLLSYALTNIWYLWQRQVRFQNDYLKRQKELYSIHYESI